MSSPTRTLRIIEPNLAGPSGHYAEYVRALAARRAPCFGRIEVHASVHASAMAVPDDGLAFVPAFRGNSREEEWSALRAAMASSDVFMVLTGHAFHATALDAIALLDRRGDDAIRRARLCFHWQEDTFVRRLAARAAPRTRRHAMAIAPTASIATFLRRTGWLRVRELAYPALAPASVPAAAARCSHLLVAGAARMNKGLSLVADYAERLGRSGDPMRLVVQTTPKRASGRRGRREGREVARLLASGAPGLEARDEAPRTDDYGARFTGALTLAPYDPASFADSVSGVVLDSLLRGAPVVATADTWPGRLVERFGAGRTFKAGSPEGFATAIAQALASWPEVAANARHAAAVLADEHDPARLVRALAED